MNFDIAIELARPHFLQGADFVRQLRLLASDIKKYFERNPQAIEVPILKGNK